MTNRDKIRRKRKEYREPLYLAKAWEVVTCPNNHPTYIVAKHIQPGDIAASGAFIPIGGSLALSKYSRFESCLCPQCKSGIFGSFPNNHSILRFYVRGRLRGTGGEYVR